MNTELSDDIKRVVELNYENNKTPKEISKEFNIKISRIYTYLRKTGKLKKKTDIRRRSFNLEYFDNINTEEKAYFLGLIYADGCNTRGGLSICLKEEDKYILAQLKKSINYSGEVRIRRARKINQSKLAVMSISSKPLSEKLDRVGIIPNKSNKINFPSENIIPAELQSHFIRGYFDGNGCVYKNKNRTCINICGSKNIIETIKMIFREKLSINDNKISSQNATYFIGFAAKKDIISIYNYMYNNAGSNFLKRKYEKFI